MFVMLALISFGNVPLRIAMATNGAHMAIYLALLGQIVVMAEDLKILALLISAASGFKKVSEHTTS